ncbi:UMP/CMP kinase [Ranunculus cassubicifolius]
MEGLQRGHINSYKVIMQLHRGPGSGKGTQCSIISDHFGFTHLSAGEVLRTELESGSENSVMIKKQMEAGELVPSDFITGLLLRAMKESGNKKFVIDGFPRSLDNLHSFETLMGLEPEFVLYLDCSEEVMKQRALSRNQGRNDDNIDTIRKRIKGMKLMVPVIEYYSSKGKLYKVNAEKTIEEVSTEIDSIFSKYMEAN